MQLVEQQVIKPTDTRYQAIDQAAFASKNLYNAANYEMRQSFIHQGISLNYEEIYARMKSHETYKALPAKVSQQVLRVLDKKMNVDCVRIVPRTGYYVVEVVYEEPEIQADVDASLYAGIDIGINNLTALTSNKEGFVPRIVNGRPVKSINQYYNKERARWQSLLKGKRHTSQKLEKLTTQRIRKIDHYLHTASRRIIDLLVSEGIGTLVIGKNPNWKQEVNIGKRNNQNFVSIPHARFIAMLTYKAKLVGIQVVVTEENYTSKCSFLDNEPLGKHEVYAGKRTKRGLFRSHNGQCINADVNGSLNIIRKVAPDAFRQGSRGCVVHPISLAV